MKIPAIKQLVEQYTKEDLENAEAAIAAEQQPNIEIPGDDEGEQLTHAYAAIQIMQSMEENGVDFKTALREYTGRVRNSIS
ncbi:hypothetical protein SAMN05421640_1014 [Ekhidna lutea]|uniref:Uncharacterized protein n=1 Tax=Ekhidna lutea TaxID=447679 RepID=A0A239GUM6_EKHLU|nr:hypothetical protein [Ekhidna lutea]SNS72830.1 hypothetical protein SAMN05421640_1014 [Ekhidna lutea]